MKNKNFVTLVVFLAVGVLRVCGAHPVKDVLNTPCDSVETFFGFPQAIETIRSAETISVALLRGADVHAGVAADYMETKARSLSEADRERMSRILLSAGTYVWPGPLATSRGEDPLWFNDTAFWHARIRAIKGTDVVNMDFSFPGYVEVSFNGTKLRYAMLGPGGRHVIGMLREYFPDEGVVNRHEKLWQVLRGNE